ncbi:hypothetical protein PRIPAC_95395 [Pristionchus pacificus]|uniref:Uncharacterized protein n=1 Tax=Pristionchus pacificus TaxID=54126 RepID=A0A2A6BCK3_PRIPA|nr:hypothetical protein PRIPAC_95395 [Pristionchus pacificus]|eukprot:PDM63594.1 hypothetical protein PRIPAC_49567 [Pristionchus pacificus]
MQNLPIRQAIFEDGQAIEMFHCKKTRIDQGRPLTIVIIENPCLFAFIILIILAITGVIIASSVLLHRMLPSHWFEIE